MYLPPFRRWHGRGFHPPDRAAWEILLAPADTRFVLTLPETWSPMVQKQLAVVWPKSTVAATPDPLADFAPTALARFELKQHFLFPLLTDRRTLGMLPSLLEVSRLLAEGERIAVQVLLDPAPPDWWQAAALAYDAFRVGRMPRRLRLDAKGVGQLALRGAAAVSLELFGIAAEILSGQAPPPIDLDGPSPATALRSLDADNALTPVPEPPAALQKMRSREPGFKVNRDYISLREAAMLVLLHRPPSGNLSPDRRHAHRDRPPARRHPRRSAPGHRHLPRQFRPGLPPHRQLG